MQIPGTSRSLSTLAAVALAAGVWIAAAPGGRAQTLRIDQNALADGAENPAAASRPDEAAAQVLTPDEWARVDKSVNRALSWLATQQQPDGSFPTLLHGQPGVSSLCVLAFMAHGHHPGEGLYGQALDRAIDFITACQKENGLITQLGPDGPRITKDVARQIGEAAVYNHAIASLALSEMYGMSEQQEVADVQNAINKSLAATLEMQRWPKDLPVDRGGWRYVTDDGPSDSDLSITGWQLMFLRSARNAGFNVPQSAIDDAVGYVRRTFHQREGAFGYTVTDDQGGSSRAMAGAGILALGHAGFHHSGEATRTGQWILQTSFEPYNGDNGRRYDRYHYSLFNCCQGMYQLGSPYWDEFFPPTVRTLLRGQRVDGSWDAESNQNDRQFGNSYATALVILSLGAPNELLPIFQR